MGVVGSEVELGLGDALPSSNFIGSYILGKFQVPSSVKKKTTTTTSNRAYFIPSTNILRVELLSDLC